LLDNYVGNDRIDVDIELKKRRSVDRNSITYRHEIYVTMLLSSIRAIPRSPSCYHTYSGHPSHPSLRRLLPHPSCNDARLPNARHLVLRLQVIIQFILPGKTPHTYTRTSTDRAVIFLGAILVLFCVASEVGGVLDGDGAAGVGTVVSLAGKGRGGIVGRCWGVAHWASRGAEGEAGSNKGWRLMVEASEVLMIRCFGHGSTIIGVWSSGIVEKSIITVRKRGCVVVLLDMLIEGCFVWEDGYLATGVNACITGGGLQPDVELARKKKPTRHLHRRRA